MKYINPNSKSGIINKFADYIVKHIGEEYKSIIEVTYLGSFFIIKGITESNKVLNLQQIRDSFVEKYSYLLSSHGITNFSYIDILQYEYKFTESDIDFKFYNSENIRYHQKVIDYVKNNNIGLNVESIDFDIVLNESISSNYIQSFNSFELLQMSLTSQFPYGYSLKAGRLNLFYSEYIINQTFGVLKIDKVIFRYSNIKFNNENNIRIFSDSILDESVTKSLILDLFDFNINKFKIEFIKDLDLEYEIENQLTPKNWYVKDKSKDIVII